MHLEGSTGAFLMAYKNDRTKFLKNHHRKTGCLVAEYCLSRENRTVAGIEQRVWEQVPLATGNGSEEGG